jgi:hypothetical protein
MRDDGKNLMLRFGSRKSGKLVRCYSKPELGIFRVEVELHADLLRSHSITQADDLVELAHLVYPKHVQFIDFDWQRLKLYLTRKMGVRGEGVFAEAKERATSIQDVARYLRQTGVLNVHRFYRPVPLNRRIVSSLDVWARTFAGG